MAELDLSTMTDEQLRSLGRESRTTSRDREQEPWVRQFFAALTSTINAELGRRVTQAQNPFRKP